MQIYKKKKEKPLSQEELTEKYNDVQEEIKIVNAWVKEEEEKLKQDKFKTYQAKSASKRNLVKAKRRVNSVSGMVDYWKNRLNGMSHFQASIELNEYWANLKKD